MALLDLPGEIMAAILSFSPDDWGSLRLTCKALNYLIEWDCLCVCPTPRDKTRIDAIARNARLSRRVTAAKIYPVGLPRLHNVFEYQDAANAQEESTLCWYENATGKTLQPDPPLTAYARYKHLLREFSVSVLVQDRRKRADVRYSRETGNN